jgi:hypothetical protein
MHQHRARGSITIFGNVCALANALLRHAPQDFATIYPGDGKLRGIHLVSLAAGISVTRIAKISCVLEFLLLAELFYSGTVLYITTGHYISILF